MYKNKGHYMQSGTDISLYFSKKKAVYNNSKKQIFYGCKISIFGRDDIVYALLVFAECSVKYK